MKAFLTRPKRKPSPELQPENAEPEESTEVKLALLSSLHPQLGQEILLDVLLAHDGSVSEASASLKIQALVKKGARVIGYQQSLKHYDEIERQKTEYHYNGGRLTDVRRITPQLIKVKPKVQEAVNSEIQKRIKSRYPGGKKLKYQSPNPWVPNSAFVNAYTGPQQNVGWHSDHLTYLGPRAVIGSISLGVAREFRSKMQKDKYQYIFHTTLFS
ncbi:hypothetical protein IL306_006275 [Fusarium sp. DS 682]|nr:hypothetical protein IL306_006275 [Fusarium sp. DS 682]